MPVERDDVIQAYRLLLGRAASEVEIETMQKNVPDLDALRRVFFDSPEFHAISGSGPRPAPGKSPALVHIHVPKSAGTSLNEILKVNFPPEAILHVATHELGQLLSRPMKARRQVKVLMGHLQHGAGRHLPQASVYVAVLRDPGPRIHSFFRFIRRHRPHPLHAEFNRLDLDFGGFLRYSLNNPSVRIEIDNGQTRRLAGLMLVHDGIDYRQMFAQAMRNVTAPDMIVGTTERFEALLYTLWARGLLRDPANRFENVGRADDSYVEALAALTEEERGLLESYSYWDRLLHRAADLMIDGTQCELPGGEAPTAAAP